MKKILLAFLIISTYYVSNSQSRLGYGAEGYANVRLLKMSGSDFTKNNNSGVPYKSNLGSFDVGIKYSVLGNLIFRDTDNKFFIGEFVDVGLGVAFYQPVALNLQLGWGLASSYRFTKDIEIGVRYTHIKIDGFFDGALNPGFVQKKTIAPSVRLKNLMFTAGVGQAFTVVQAGHKGICFMAEGRYLFDPNDDECKYLGFKIENYNGKGAEGSGSTGKLNGFFIGITAGIMVIN